MGEPHKQHRSQVGPCSSPFEKAQTYADQTTPFDSLFWDVPCSHITYRLEVCDHGAGGCREVFSFKKRLLFLILPLDKLTTVVGPSSSSLVSCAYSQYVLSSLTHLKLENLNNFSKRNDNHSFL